MRLAEIPHALVWDGRGLLRPLSPYTVQGRAERTAGDVLAGVTRKAAVESPEAHGYTPVSLGGGLRFGKGAK